MLRSLRLSLLLLAGYSAAASAQSCNAGYAHVTARLIQSIAQNSGAPGFLASGSFSIQATAPGTLQPSSTTVLASESSSSGITTITRKAVPVVNGAITQVLCVPKTTSATPNVVYDIQVKDTTPFGGGAVVIHFQNVAINVDEWDFDTFISSATVLLGAPGLTYGSGPPSGTCIMPSLYEDALTGNLYTCDAGAWILPSASGGPVNLSINTISGLSGGGVLSNGNPLSIGPDSTHYLPQNNQTSTCFWNGVGSCANPLPVVNANVECNTVNGLYWCVDAQGRSTLGVQFDFSFSCSAAGTFEIGHTSSNPNTCTFGYNSGTVTGATLTDSSSNSGTFNTGLTTGTLAHSYTTSQTFTGSAATSTQNATHSAYLNLVNCGTYVGTGNAGGNAVSASGSGSCGAGETATVTNISGTVLTSVGLGSSQVGDTYNLTLAGNYAVLLLDGGCGHTFTVNSTPTAFTTQAISGYSNLLGGAQAGECLYTSPSSGSGTVQIKRQS